MAIIKTDTAYRKERERFARVSTEITRIRNSLVHEGASPDEIEAELEPLMLRTAELAEQLALYERLQRGDLSGLAGLTLGQRLIAVRIARKIQQNELATLTGVHPTQVSRDEASEYRATTLDRLQQVANQLSIHLTTVPAEQLGVEAPAAEAATYELIPPLAGHKLEIDTVASVPHVGRKAVLAAASAASRR